MMTPAEIYTSLGIVLTFLLGLFNLLYKKREVGQGDVKITSEYFRTTNEAIKLSNERALAAEKYSADLEKRLDTLEENLSYRITFDVILGILPKVENVAISHVSKEIVKEK